DEGEQQEGPALDEEELEEILGTASELRLAGADLGVKGVREQEAVVPEAPEEVGNPDGREDIARTERVAEPIPVRPGDERPDANHPEEEQPLRPDQCRGGEHEG